MAEAMTIEAAGREVNLSNPDEVFFPKAGHTKLDLCRYSGAKRARGRRS